MSDPLLLTDEFGHISAANAAAIEVLGPTTGRRCNEFVDAVHPDGSVLCATCSAHLEPDESRVRERVLVRGLPIALHCARVGDVQVVEFRDAEPEPAPSMLSPREREVLLLVARGMTNRRIAQRLTLSDATVRTHMEHVLAKLGVHTRSQAVARALSLGEIE